MTWVILSLCLCHCLITQMPVPKPMYHELPQHDAMWPSTLFPKETKFDSAGISAEAVFVLFRKGDAENRGLAKKFIEFHVDGIEIGDNLLGG